MDENRWMHADDKPFSVYAQHFRSWLSMSNQDALGEDAGQQFVNQKAYEGDEADKTQNFLAIKSVYNIKFQTDSMIFWTTSDETHPKVTLSLV